MDFTPLILTVVSKLWYLIPLVILVTLLKSAWFKGVVGESIVNLSAKLMLNSDEYHLIKNVTLPTEGGTTQIDHIIVSPYGVFVMETKNMKGWIFGGERQKSWTQKIFKHSQKFQNPLHQNYKHVKSLEQLLELRPEQLHSLVVFIGDSTFKTKMPENVTQGGGYIRYIKSKRDVLLTQGEITTVIDLIESGRFARSLKTHVNHAKHVQKIVRKKDESVSCPKCGDEMVLREVKRGANVGKTFWGCTRFPSCRGVQNVA